MSSIYSLLLFVPKKSTGLVSSACENCMNSNAGDTGLLCFF